MIEGRIEKSSELRVAIYAAIGMAVLFSICAFFSNSTLQVNSLGFESYETVHLLKKQVQELKEELEAAKQENKAGPFGSVKSEINPTVSLDESKNPKLAKILTKIAINKEFIVVLANSNVHPLLELQISSIKRLGISNYLVYALDNATVHLCKSNKITYYEGVDGGPVGKSPVGSGVPALKLQVLREFLEIGYNVLLSDTDVLFLQNPFNHLCRDSDLESMSDGHDAWSAYGYNDAFDDPEMEWSRWIYTTRIWAFNSGFFYIRATVPGIELLDRATASLRRRPGVWDQTVYNEELFLPSRPGYVGLTAAKRAMDIYLFMNSKVLFKTVRKDPELRKKMPVIIHINYHPDKLPRMKAAFEFYVNGKEDALDPFSVGTPRT